MGTQQSSLAESASTEVEQQRNLDTECSGDRGLKVTKPKEIQEPGEVPLDSSDSLVETDSDSDSGYDTDDEDSEDEGLLERLRILEDAKQLKALAVAFLHPEKPVEVDATACARCFFGRPSAPEQEDVETADYRRQILEDAASLKQSAVYYAHPEIGVETSDVSATARNYFGRASAPDQETYEEAEERFQVLEDVKMLREAAFHYLHPEAPVQTTDASAMARCYFDRASAPEQEDVETAEYRRQVLEDAVALKNLAVDYAHPELPVATTDTSATARCYFGRPSAPQQESLGVVEYREQVLADAAALKQLAINYAHPEVTVETSDATATARCFFDRASAPQQESLEEVEYRSQVLADAIALKKLAVDYAHPELPVASTDATASARCYFNRASAPQQESLEEVEYRNQVLADAIALKQSAINYAHPELPVASTDATSSARCYFDRASAPQQESLEEVEYRSQVLADAIALKKLAVDYAHPELPVASTDATASARCYFDRATAPQQEDLDTAEYREQVLADVAALKQLAADYAHPELPVATTDPTAFGRNYFSRPSAANTKVATTVQKSSPKVVIVEKPVTRSTRTAKTVNITKDIDIVRSLSSVQLFGLDGEGDASY